MTFYESLVFHGENIRRLLGDIPPTNIQMECMLVPAPEDGVQPTQEQMVARVISRILSEAATN